MQQTFEILDGLLPYGPMPLQFSSTGQGMHREGLVVKFVPGEEEEWVGNFQPGLSSFHSVLAHPDHKHVVVVAGGEAYVVDPTARKLVTTFGVSIETAIDVPLLKAILFSNGLWFELLGEGGLMWKTRRLSWDGMRNVEVRDLQVRGEGWRFDDTWHEFALDLSNGKVTGGAYDGPEP
jgi:hypothetical protein